MYANMIQPGDKVLLVVPADHMLKMDTTPEEFADTLDGYYEGVEFEVFPTDGREARLLFIYRDPEAYALLRREKEIAEASQRAGVTPEVIQRVRGVSGSVW